jgi:CRP/FNR family cyclic AMP-dependent transcriptional regulator
MPWQSDPDERAAMALNDLPAFPLFLGIEPDLLPHRPARRFAAGQQVYQRDDPGGEVFFLRQGQLLAAYLTEDGREIVFGQIGPGSHFGEIAALDGKARSLAVYARTAAECFVMSAAELRGLIDSQPLVRERILQHLTAMVRRLTARAWEGSALTVAERVQGHLAALALAQGAFRPGGVLDKAPTHAELAASLGVNREAVSRAMSTLARQGAIAGGRGRIEILLPDLLLAGRG